MSVTNKKTLHLIKTDFEKINQLLSFYFAYLPSRTALSETFARLEKILSRALIVETGKIPKGIATLNSLVAFVDVETGNESHAVVSLTSSDTNAEKKISIFSTFGCTVLGSIPGDLVQHDTHEGMRKFFIKSVNNE